MLYKDPEQVRAYHQRYREAHREKARAYGIEYRKNNREKIKGKNKQWEATRGTEWREKRRLASNSETVECLICHRQYIFLGRHLPTHGITTEQYRETFPGAQMLSSALSVARGQSGLRRAFRNDYDGKEPNALLFAFLTGAMLGDGSLEHVKLNARYADASSNEAYATWKYDFLRAYFPATITRRTSQPHKRTGNRYTAWFVRTSSHPLLTEWHGLWYQGKKIVPRNVVTKYLDSFALAVWYFDDGNNSNGGAYLYPLGFSLSDVEWLAGLLLDRFGLVTSVRVNRTGQGIIYVRRQSKAHFLDLVRPHVVPGMDYKVMTREGVIHNGADRTHDAC